MQQPPNTSLCRLARFMPLWGSVYPRRTKWPIQGCSRHFYEYLALNNWKPPCLWANFLNCKTVLPVCLVLKRILDHSCPLLSSPMSSAQPPESLLAANTWSHLSHYGIFASLAKLLKLLSLQQSHDRTTSAAIAGPVPCFLRCRWKCDLHLGVISHSSPRWIAVDPPWAA